MDDKSNNTITVYEKDLRFIHDLSEELKKARDKFPGSEGSLIALVEEVGGLAKAHLEEGRVEIWSEAIQVAVMAMRVAVEGDRINKDR